MNASRIFLAGHRGMVGAAIQRRLARENVDVLTAGHETLDLREQADVRAYMERERPDVVVLAAAKVGGILANDSFPADFLGDNLAIELNIIHEAHRAGVERLVFLGSSCIYPKFAAQPIREEALLTGALEPTNEWYAIAKIAGIKLCQAYRRQYGRHYISLMPCNLYGPNDNFDLATSHVLPALIRKFHEAKQDRKSEVVVWGSGTPRREFMHVDDLADATVFLMRHYDEDGPINCGAGFDLSIGELAEKIRRIVEFEGRIVFDATKPDGTPRKLMDSSRIVAQGWKPKIDLDEGIADAYRWFLEHQAEEHSRTRAMRR
ncbi:GDP-L-fucose synthase [Methylovirgula sp. HY1]|uniref:GDP-L-fucose synthase n=1 Tax=Methylovirgula sp. HY1 TaxID=2822761 RepID=UPI001C5AF609|nr:GDP-L-fucose synthase [Methylovirgula sp. HY1]QXX76691.1 GDP-L-fucose synthase [Methylovirgula sp. HY1]